MQDWPNNFDNTEQTPVKNYVNQESISGNNSLLNQSHDNRQTTAQFKVNEIRENLSLNEAETITPKPLTETKENFVQIKDVVQFSPSKKVEVNLFHEIAGEKGDPNIVAINEEYNNVDNEITSETHSQLVQATDFSENFKPKDGVLLFLSDSKENLCHRVTDTMSHGDMPEVDRCSGLQDKEAIESEIPPKIYFSPNAPWRRNRQRHLFRVIFLAAGFFLIGGYFTIHHFNTFACTPDIGSEEGNMILSERLYASQNELKKTDEIGEDSYKHHVLRRQAGNNTMIKPKEAKKKARNDTKDYLSRIKLSFEEHRFVKHHPGVCTIHKGKKGSCQNYGNCKMNKVKELRCQCQSGRGGWHCETKCTIPSIYHFPRDLLHEYTDYGAWIIHFLAAIYMFIAIAMVCDNYFVPSLEHICEDLGLQADVAGATFMAAGSSAPELATSMIGLFLAKSDLGVGTIVGSSIFNLLFIVGACAIFAGMTIQLTWYPMARDTVFYILAVLELLTILFDGTIAWWEALIMVLTYGCYVVVMIFNKKIETYSHRFDKYMKKPREKEDDGEAKEREEAEIDMMKARRKSRIASVMTEDEIGENLKTSRTQMAALKVTNSALSKEPTPIPSKVTSNPSKVSQESSKEEIPVKGTSSKYHSDQEYENPLKFPDKLIARAFWIFTLPIVVLHVFTIPDSRRHGTWHAKLYPISFIIAVTYIAMYSYLMVWMMTIVSDALEIPETIVGLTILAAGTSVPDCLSSVFVAQDGYGDMAVSNAIGSNIFDILLGLGLPWLIDGIVNVNIGHSTSMESAGVRYITIIMLSTSMYLFVSLRIQNWKLTKRYGYITFAFYCFLIITCIVIEYKMRVISEYCNKVPNGDTNFLKNWD